MNSFKKSLNQIGLMTFSLVLMSSVDRHCHAQGGYANVRSVYYATENARQSETGLDAERNSAFEVKEMTKKLKLTDEQVGKVERIVTAYMIKRVDLFNEMKKLTPPIPEEVRSKMHDKITALKVGKDRELKAVLSEDQYQQYLVQSKR